MAGENQELFDMSEYRLGKEKPVSELDRALKRVSDMEERILRSLESRLIRSDRLTAADYRMLESLRETFSTRKTEERSATFVETAKEVAEHFKRTVRTVRNWAGRGMPQEVDGYDLLKIERWALAEGVIKDPIALTEGPVNDASEDQGALGRSYYETEIKRLDSELKSLKVQKETGALISREEVERAWVDRAFVFKRDLLGMARRLSLKGAGKEAPELYGLINADAREVLRKYSRGHDSENG